MPSLNTKLASAPNTTANYVLKATSSTTIGNSSIQDTGSLVTVTSPTDIVTGSGIGSSGVTGLLRVVTAGTSSAIAVGQANSSRYTSIQANEYITYNDDMSFRTFGSFPLTLGTNNTTRLTISATGAATFSNLVSAATEFRLNNNTFTRIATMDSGGGFGGGYNFNWNNGSPINDSTGALAGFGYASDGSVRLYSNVSSSAGSGAPLKILLASNGRTILNSGTDRGYQFQVNGDASSYACEIRQSNNSATYDLLTLTHEATSGNRRMVIFNTGGFGTVGTIISTNSSTTYNTNSDYRLKEDLKEVNGLEKVSAIKVYDFKWKIEDARMDGVLAHELAEVLPYAVYGDKDGVDEDGKPIMQGVDYSKIVPVLVKAIQEQQAMIEAQQQQINQLINK